jgi:hypothetical protein
MKTDEPKPPPRNWTSARLESLTGSQVKALLEVASESRPGSAEPVKVNVIEEERLLDEMTRARADSNAGLLDRASKEGTAVEELVRIKDLAKVLIKESDNGSQREAARLLYQVAVAAALVHHAVSISGRPIQKQHLLYDRLAAEWAGHPFGRLFGEAAARSTNAHVSTLKSE